MANWYGAARSNYVQISDMEGLKASLKPFPISIEEKGGLFCLLSEDPDSGGWPSSAYLDDDYENEFSFEEHVMPYVKEGEVLIVMEAGHEKMRYITGYAEAYIRKPTGIESVSISLADIYALAKNTFGITAPISKAEY